MAKKDKDPEEVKDGKGKQPEAEKTDATNVSAKPNTESGKNSAPQGDMKAVSVWAKEFGTERWQVAAMLRLKRWAADKQVSKTEYQDAINALLKHRPGRR